jgi:hypothetical protein
MKIKSLLVLAAGVIALNANAVWEDQVFDENCTLSGAGVETLQAGGDAGTLTITFARDEASSNLLPDGKPAGADFTNIQSDLVFPMDASGKGIRPVQDEYGDWVYGLVRNARGNELVSFSVNWNDPENDKWPNVRFVGANTTKTKITTNPTDLMEFCIKADEGMLTGDYDIQYHTLKYVAYTDEQCRNLEGGVLCTVHVDGASGVNDINAAKAVASVKYFNAAGMASDSAFDGVNIVVTKYADGTQSVAKVVK